MTLADQAHFNNYDPSSFGWPHHVPDLVPFTFQGVNFGQCARDVHGVFMAVLTELVPHIPGGIAAVKAVRDDWAYSTTDDLPDGSWSFHRYGIAFDLDWSKNPMGTYSTNPFEGQQGAIPHAAASAIATKYGCEYGGDWSGGPGHRGFKDYMHFECHLSPSVARTVKAPSTDWLDTVDEATLRKIVREEVGSYTQLYDPETKKWDGKPHQISTLIAMQLVRYGLTGIRAAVDAVKKTVGA